MPNSPAHPEERSTSPVRRRICDFCCETTAVLFCRADAAKLCLGCDREVHASVQLFTKHTRWLLCDACDSSPALILCSTHRRVLCQNCDFELHNCSGSLTSNGSASNSASASAHDRRPLEGFSGRPSVSEIVSFVGLEGLDCKSLEGEGFGEKERDGFWGGGFWEGEEAIESGIGGGGVSDFWVRDAIAPQGVVSIDDLIVSSSEMHGFEAMVGLDALPKDRNSTCGQHKQEIIRQLCKLAKLETDSNQDFESVLGHQTARYEHGFGVSDTYEGYQHDLELMAVPGQEEASLYLQGSKDDDEAFNEAFLSDTLFGSNTEEVPFNNEPLANNGRQGPAHNVAIPSKTSTPEVNSADRGSALSRYKEKKRSRRYDKHIRYESRKVLAESRTRIKGRFAKINRSSTRI